MRTTGARRHTAIAAIAGLIIAAGVAQAQSKKVIKMMKGSIIITNEPLSIPDGTDKAVVKQLKKANKSSVKHFMADAVPNWQFHFTAFMKQAPGVTELSFDFYTDDKEKLYVANKRLTGIDAKLRVVQGRIDISEDDNVNKGQRYIIKLSATRGNKETILATTRLQLK